MPNLIAISGPLRGATFAPREEAITFGRGKENQFILDDPGASRRHCVIRKEGERFKIFDLKSRNGTYVNGLPVRERPLQHGDEIRIGNSVFLFHPKSGLPAEDSDSVSLDDTLLVTRSAAVLRSEDAHAHYARGRASQAEPEPAQDAARDLDALFRITEALHGGSSTQEMFKKLLETAFQIVPFDRGAVLLLGPAGELTFALGIDHRDDKSEQVPVSPGPVGRVTKERVAVIDECAGEDGRPLWILAAPLLCLDRTIGILYLDTASADVAAELDRELLQLFAAIGTIAGLAIENARRMEQLEAENLRLRAENNLEHDMVGESAAMRQVFRFIGKVAPTAATVLIEGESGTGKELVARAIHRNSQRATGPFVAINCAALTESLLESELFGHERGAFTGAVGMQKGKFEAADGGTIFLDEIGELAPAMQAKLLRVLQERQFERVGSTRPIRVDVRVVAATNRDLAEVSKSGGFRRDLYFRLNVVALKMPALRERRQDILPISEYFAVKAAKRCNRRISGISLKARDLLMRYSWPGNVRELENAIERAVVLGLTDVILPEDLPDSVHDTAPAVDGGAGTLQEAIHEAKKIAIGSALEQAGWNYTEAAKLLDVHPNYLHRLIQNMGLKLELKRKALEAVE